MPPLSKMDFSGMLKQAEKGAKTAGKFAKQGLAESGLLGSYTIGGKEVVELRKIASGGFASVKLVREVHTLQEYALKKIKCTNASTQVTNTTEEAEREARLLAKMSHPNIIKCVSWGKREGYKKGTAEVILLLELCPKGHVLQFLNENKGVLRSNDIVTCIFQTLDALHFLHNWQRFPIAHRDIKLENILRAKDGRWKLCDFGSMCCRKTIYPKDLSKKGLSDLQDEIDKKVTMLYRPPEMVDLNLSRDDHEDDWPIGPKVDVWMAGCVLFCLIFNVHPFQNSATPMAIRNAKYYLPVKHPNINKKQLILLAQWFLSPRPQDRPSTEQALDVLEKWQSSPDIFELLPKTTQDRLEKSWKLYGVKFGDKDSSSEGVFRMERFQFQKRSEETEDGKPSRPNSPTGGNSINLKDTKTTAPPPPPPPPMVNLFNFDDDDEPTPVATSNKQSKNEPFDPFGAGGDDPFASSGFQSASSAAAPAAAPQNNMIDFFSTPAAPTSTTTNNDPFGGSGGFDPFADAQFSSAPPPPAVSSTPAPAVSSTFNPFSGSGGMNTMGSNAAPSNNIDVFGAMNTPAAPPPLDPFSGIQPDIKSTKSFGSGMGNPVMGNASSRNSGGMGGFLSGPGGNMQPDIRSNGSVGLTHSDPFAAIPAPSGNTGGRNSGGMNAFDSCPAPGTMNGMAGGNPFSTFSSNGGDDLLEAEPNRTSVMAVAPQSTPANPFNSDFNAPLTVPPPAAQPTGTNPFDGPLSFNAPATSVPPPATQPATGTNQFDNFGLPPVQNTTPTPDMNSFNLPSNPSPSVPETTNLFSNTEGNNTPLHNPDPFASFDLPPPASKQTKTQQSQDLFDF